MKNKEGKDALTIGVVKKKTINRHRKIRKLVLISFV